jgi:uncharacterized protein YcbK (DUF882 family)
MMLPRRAFLRMSGASLLTAAASNVAAPAFAGIASPALVGLKDTGARTLAVQCLRTGEKLKADYWVNGAYVPDALGALNRVLRDGRTGEVHVMEPKLLDLLNLLGRQLETSAPFHVICGYRSPATNAMLHATSTGVASKSLHMEGKAIDIRVPDRSLKTLHDTALAMQVGGVGYYPKSDFVHVDVGQFRSWNG